MKNLAIVYENLEKCVSEDSGEVICGLLSSHLSKTLFFVTKDLVLHRRSLPEAEDFRGSHETRIILDLVDPVEDPLPDNSKPIAILAGEYDEDDVFVALDSGSLVKVSWEESQATVVGSFGDGLAAVKSSPDLQLVVAITGSGQSSSEVMVMTGCPDLDVLVQNPLEKDEKSEEAVSIGWGSKETQFHGKAGKAAAKQSKSTAKAADPNYDNGDVKIEWTEDSQTFAISHLGKSDRVRKIRIFDREGTLMHISDLDGCHDGLEPVLTWKNTGHLMATGIRMANKHVVGFYEKNGLRHGEFRLPFKEVNRVAITSLQWNNDASILAVTCKDVLEEGLFYFQAWTVSNYKWQLKQSQVLKNPIKVLEWDAINPSILYFVTSDGVFHHIHFRTKIDHSNEKSCSDLTNVAVIDDKTLKMTPFRETVIPPPISAYEVHFPHPIRDVAFSSNRDELLVHTADDQIWICDAKKNDAESIDGVNVIITGAGGQGFVPKCTALIPSSSHKIHKEPVGHNLCWLPEHQLVISSKCDHLLVHNNSGELKAKHKLKGTITGIVGIIGDVGALIQLNTGDVLQYDPSGSTITEFLHGGPSMCLNMGAIKRGKVALTRLSTKHRLYLNKEEILNGVTSFFIHSDFLMVTTIQHQLKTLPLSALFGEFDKSWSMESVREVERGTRLVTADSKGTKTILQMPRGNLEIIHPRSLALHIVKELLDELRYDESLDILRRQRINQNIIVDHNPGLFIENVDTFVNKVPDKHKLSLFIADLSENDVSKDMYSHAYSGQERSPYNFEHGNKIDTICSALESNFRKRGEEYFIPTISCIVKSSKTKVDDALIKIQSLRATNEGLANDALNFLILLVDVNELFNIALGVYDFDLVLFVAEKSQKDPKEYLPFLNELKKLPESYRKYKIDMHLKRFSSALHHIAKQFQEDPDQNFMDELLRLVKEQRLYKEALPIFSKGAAKATLNKAYGDYLFSKKYYIDSALIYQDGGWTREAIDAWSLSSSWHQSLAESKGVLSDVEYADLSKKIVERLRNNNLHRDAAFILKDHLHDDEEAVAAFVDGKCWAEARSLIASMKRVDLMETHYKPKLKEASKHFLDNLMNSKRSFESHCQRLKIVYDFRSRVLSGAHPNMDENEDGFGPTPGDDSDLYSEVGSHAGMSTISAGQKSNPHSLQTRASNQSRKSARSRRKQKLKLYTAKEGSEHEDLGIIATLHGLVSEVYGHVGDAKSLIQATYIIGERNEAKTIQTCLSDSINLFQKEEKSIWVGIDNSAPDDPNGDASKFGPNATVADIIAQKTTKTEYTPPYSLLEAKLRYPPIRPANVWDFELEILK